MEEILESTVIRWRLNSVIQGCCTTECTGYELCTRKVQHNQKSHLQMLNDQIRINKVAKYIVATRHISVHEILYENISAIIVMTIIKCTHASIKWMQDGLQRCQVKYEPFCERTITYQIVSARCTISNQAHIWISGWIYCSARRPRGSMSTKTMQGILTGKQSQRFFNICNVLSRERKNSIIHLQNFFFI
jgi:hypothetical protein